MLHLKLLAKEEQAKPKANRREQIVKIRAQIKAIESKNIYKELMKQRAGFLRE